MENLFMRVLWSFHHIELTCFLVEVFLGSGHFSSSLYRHVVALRGSPTGSEVTGADPDPGGRGPLSYLRAVWRSKRRPPGLSEMSPLGHFGDGSSTFCLIS